MWYILGIWRAKSDSSAKWNYPTCLLTSPTVGFLMLFAFAKPEPEETYLLNNKEGERSSDCSIILIPAPQGFCLQLALSFNHLAVLILLFVYRKKIFFSCLINVLRLNYCLQTSLSFLEKGRHNYLVLQVYSAYRFSWMQNGRLFKVIPVMRERFCNADYISLGDKLNTSNAFHINLRSHCTWTKGLVFYLLDDQSPLQMN